MGLIKHTKQLFHCTLELGCSESTPIWRKLYLQLKEQIRAGYYREGDSLPSIRGLAEQLGISKNTVISAFDTLVSEGYAVATPRSGFCVAEVPEKKIHVAPQRRPIPSVNIVENQQRHAEKYPLVSRQIPHNLLRQKPYVVHDFALGRPDPSLFPGREWSRLLTKKMLGSRCQITEYLDPQGLIEFRRAIANHVYKARGIEATEEQVLIVSGIQEGLSLVINACLPKNGTAVVEDPCYGGAYNLLRSTTENVVQLDTAPASFNISNFPASAHLAYLTPSHQYPFGHTLEREKRQQILDWAWESGAWLLEDDYDSDFRYDGPPLPALAALDKRGSTIYLGTFSKALGAGLRLGYMIVPKEVVGSFVTAKTLLNNGQGWLLQSAMAEFIASGRYAGHLCRIRKEYLSRRDTLVNTLLHHWGEVDLLGLQCGMHLAWRLPDAWPNAKEIAKCALANGVRVYTTESAAAGTENQEFARRYLLLGYASLAPDTIQTGIDKLSQSIKSMGV